MRKTMLGIAVFLVVDGLAGAAVMDISRTIPAVMADIQAD